MAQLIQYSNLYNYVDLTKEPVLSFEFTPNSANTGNCDFYIKDINGEEIYTTNSLAPSISNNIRTYYFDSSNILYNNNYYIFYFKRNDVSNYDSTNIWCIPSPQFTISNVSNTVNNSSIQVEVQLNKYSSDYLNSFEFWLDDQILYNYWDYTWDEASFDITGLTDGDHTIKVIGKSKYGFTGSTSKQFTVKDEQIHLLFDFSLENIYDEGKIQINSSVINIVGTPKFPVSYVSNNSMVDLTNNIVAYTDKFNIENDFYIKVHMKDIHVNNKIPFLKLFSSKSSQNARIECYWWYKNYDCNSLNDEERWAIYVELRAIYGSYTYTIASNYIIADINSINDTEYFVGIKKQNNYYEVYIEEYEGDNE